MNVYFISGLAADERVFSHILLPDGCQPVHLNWIPAQEKESLQGYASRLSQKINASEPFAIIGLSMGGMVATEIAKKFNPVATILLSSVPSHRHFPLRIKVSGALRLNRLLPVSFFKKASLIKRFFTTEATADKALLEQVIRDSDPVFISWALGAILEWRNEALPKNYFHIHGNRDEIFPMTKTKPTHIIKGGTHLMVLSKANEINVILREILSSHIH